MTCLQLIDNPECQAAAQEWHQTRLAQMRASVKLHALMLEVEQREVEAFARMDPKQITLTFADLKITDLGHTAQQLPEKERLDIYWRWERWWRGFRYGPEISAAIKQVAYLEWKRKRAAKTRVA